MAWMTFQEATQRREDAARRQEESALRQDLIREQLAEIQAQRAARAQYGEARGTLGRIAGQGRPVELAGETVTAPGGDWGAPEEGLSTMTLPGRREMRPWESTAQMEAESPEARTAVQALRSSGVTEPFNPAQGGVESVEAVSTRIRERGDREKAQTLADSAARLAQEAAQATDEETRQAKGLASAMAFFQASSLRWPGAVPQAFTQLTTWITDKDGSRQTANWVAEMAPYLQKLAKGAPWSAEDLYQATAISLRYPKAKIPTFFEETLLSQQRQAIRGPYGTIMTRFLDELKTQPESRPADERAAQAWAGTMQAFLAEDKEVWGRYLVQMMLPKSDGGMGHLLEPFGVNAALGVDVKAAVEGKLAAAKETPAQKGERQAHAEYWKQAGKAKADAPAKEDRTAEHLNTMKASVLRQLQALQEAGLDEASRAEQQVRLQDRLADLDAQIDAAAGRGRPAPADAEDTDAPATRPGRPAATPTPPGAAPPPGSGRVTEATPLAEIRDPRVRQRVAQDRSHAIARRLYGQRFRTMGTLTPAELQAVARERAAQENSLLAGWTSRRPR